jgi:hypothetical protein
VCAQDAVADGVVQRDHEWLNVPKTARPPSATGAGVNAARILDG